MNPSPQMRAPSSFIQLPQPNTVRQPHFPVSPSRQPSKVSMPGSSDFTPRVPFKPSDVPRHTIFSAFQSCCAYRSGSKPTNCVPAIPSPNSYPRPGSANGSRTYAATREDCIWTDSYIMGRERMPQHVRTAFGQIRI